MVTNINAENDWNFDFSSLPRWDVRDRIPFVYDRFYPLSECDALCCIYSIAEVRMGCYQGFLAILKNKEKPELYVHLAFLFASHLSAALRSRVHCQWKK